MARWSIFFFFEVKRNSGYTHCGSTDYDPKGASKRLSDNA